MHSAPEGFYFQASNGSVALPVAGYIYNSDWTPLLAGLSPAGMAANPAATGATPGRARRATVDVLYRRRARSPLCAGLSPAGMAASLAAPGPIRGDLGGAPGILLIL